MAWNNNGWMAAEVRGVLSGLHFGVSRSWGGTRFAPRGTNEVPWWRLVAACWGASR